MQQLSAQRDKEAEREGMFFGMFTLQILLSAAQSLFLTPGILPTVAAGRKKGRTGLEGGGPGGTLDNQD